MASLSLLLLTAALLHTTQPLPAALGVRHGLDGAVGGARRQRRDVHSVLPYGEQLSYPASHGRSAVNELYYPSDDWRGRGLDQALQQLVERDQRWDVEEEQRAAYMSTLLRLLNEAESARLVGPGDVEVVEEEVDDEEEDDQEPPDGFQRPIPVETDETGQGLVVGRPSATWWGRLEPQLAQALLDRMEPQLAQALLERARQEKMQQARRVSSGLNLGRDQEALRHLVSKVLRSPNSLAAMSSTRRMRRDLTPLGSAHRRARRSLDDAAPPSPSSNPPLLRVKRLEEEEAEEEEAEEEGPRPPAGLQRMKRIDEDLGQGRRQRRRRAVLTFDPQLLVRQVIEYMQE